MKEQYFDEKAPYFIENQTVSDRMNQTLEQEETSFSQQQYLTLPEELYKIPIASRRTIGYVKK